MTRVLTLLFAIAGGAAVGNLYWAQPLLGDISHALGVSTTAAGFLVTVTQVGYAIGVFLIVPLGDVLNRRKLIPLVMAVSAITLLATAFAPNFAVLLVALAAVGLTTVAGQLLLPLAGDLADPADRGRIIGTVASGLLTGILLSRTISGFVADAFGWRSIFIFAAVVTFVLAAILWRKMPQVASRDHVPYGQLLKSVFAVVKRHKAAQITLMLSPVGFCVFTLFWTALTFLLSSPPFSFSPAGVGLVGLVGLIGAATAQRAGRLHDRGWSIPASGIFLLLALISLVISGFGSTSIVIILIAVFFLDIAIQGLNVLNQTRMFTVDPASRSRLNTAFVACNFIGGAIGSALAGVLWDAGGWVAVMIGGAVLVGFALTVWVVHRTRGLVTPTAS